MLAATLSIVSGLTPPKGGIIPAEDIYSFQSPESLASSMPIFAAFSLYFDPSVAIRIRSNMISSLVF